MITLHRIETGAGGVNIHLVRSMMDLFDDRMDGLLDLVRQSRQRGWWRFYGIADDDFIALESAATRISTYQNALVPGLLQTAGYAGALFSSWPEPRTDEWIDNQLAVRLIRQERLAQEDQSLELTAIIDEFALCRPVGGAAVMRAQLEHLVLITELPTVTLRVLPASVVTTVGMHGGFSLLDFGFAGLPSIACLQHAFGPEHKDKGEWVEQARRWFEHLCSLALAPAESIEWLDRAADKLWSA